MSSFSSRQDNVQSDLQQMRDEVKKHMEEMMSLSSSSSKFVCAVFEIAKRKFKSCGKPISSTILESASKTLEMMTKRRAELEDAKEYSSLMESIDRSIQSLEEAQSQLGKLFFLFLVFRRENVSFALVIFH